ncbi:hypothetical protein KI387_008822, partial [Taxus chinensis]
MSVPAEGKRKDELTTEDITVTRVPIGQATTEGLKQDTQTLIDALFLRLDKEKAEKVELQKQVSQLCEIIAKVAKSSTQPISAQKQVSDHLMQEVEDASNQVKAIDEWKSLIIRQASVQLGEVPTLLKVMKDASDQLKIMLKRMQALESMASSLPDNVIAFTNEEVVGNVSSYTRIIPSKVPDSLEGSLLMVQGRIDGAVRPFMMDSISKLVTLQSDIEKFGPSLEDVEACIRVLNEGLLQFRIEKEDVAKIDGKLLNYMFDKGPLVNMPMLITASSLKPHDISSMPSTFAAREHLSVPGQQSKVADHIVHEGETALYMKAIAPDFRLLDSGAMKLSKEGAVLLSFAHSVGEKQYDLNKKQVFALKVTELGTLLSLSSNESCEFFHDTLKHTSAAGKIHKVLQVTPFPNGPGYFLSLKVSDKIKNIEEHFSVPITKAEFTLMRGTFN